MSAPISNADLTGLNSFGFQSTAQYLVQASCDDELLSAIEFANERALPLLVIGGGSNLVLGERVPGVVLQLSNTGYRLVSEDADSVLVEVGAGQNWHQLVVSMTSEGWHGLENLALIPGTAGAAPVQNIGAYGVELKDSFESLEAFDRETGSFVEMKAEQCGFGYRNSIFKTVCLGRYIIVRVRFRLNKSFCPRISYGALSQYLEGSAPGAVSVLNAVISVRRSKLPDPADIGNAGSFFENPVVPLAQYEALIKQYPEVVAFKDKPGYMKLAAGWLIDQAGWKGYREGAVGVYDKQALVLVNHGGGNASELMLLAEKIQRSVYERYAIHLVPEPRCYP